MKYVIGVDVGTGSARAGVFDETGHLYATSEASIILKRPKSDWAEQSSDNIWSAICYCIKTALSQCNIAPSQIEGLSFSATCSLVLLNHNYKPLVLSPDDELWNIIVWMDHRATKEAQEINTGGSKVLTNLGGTISPEMEIPKLMWLKRNRPDIWERLGYAGDLADFLTFKACGSLERSVCTIGCKWTYNADEDAWDKVFLSSVGLDDLLEKAKLPEKALPVGSHLGFLSTKSAKELGLTTNCQVAAGLIDAHSGALGTLGVAKDRDIDKGLALIAGTSNCHIVLSSTRREVPGVWGPYSGAVKDSLWVNEGGQSITGGLMDYIVKLFTGDKFGDSPHQAISSKLAQLNEDGLDFAGDIHILPDFLGNRSPFADPKMRGAIVGLTIEDPDKAFMKVYWATAASIAYGTRMIIDRMNKHGFKIDTIHLSGGHKKSDFLVGLYADATGCDVLISEAPEPVLLGAAVAALSQFESSSSAAMNINQKLAIRKPNAAALSMHDKRYKIFLELYKHKKNSYNL